jgi:hypothetical protein
MINKKKKEFKNAVALIVIFKGIYRKTIFVGEGD